MIRLEGGDRELLRRGRGGGEVEARRIRRKGGERERERERGGDEREGSIRTSRPPPEGRWERCEALGEGDLDLARTRRADGGARGEG